MSNRLGFTPPDRPELDRLLRESAGRKLTPREIWLQRVSFAYGNTAFDNDRITRDMVERLAIEMYGPCPDA